MEIIGFLGVGARFWGVARTVNVGIEVLLEMMG